MGRRQGAVGDPRHAAVEAVEVRVIIRAVTALSRGVEVTVHVHRRMAQHTALSLSVGRSGKSVDFMEVDLSVVLCLFCVASDNLFENEIKEK